MNEKYHERILEKNHISGGEEWYCPACERRFLVQWAPAYRLIILASGDSEVQHNVSKSNVRIGSCSVAQPGATDLIEEFRLLPWIKWMQQIDFDSKWGKNVYLT